MKFKWTALMDVFVSVSIDHTQDGQMTTDGEDISELTRESWEVSHMFSILSFLILVNNINATNTFSDNLKSVFFKSKQKLH